MKKIAFLLGCVALLTMAKGASAHGVPMYIGADAGGKLYSQSFLTYDPTQSLLKPTPTGSPVAIVGNAALHFLGGNGVGTGTAWTFDVTGSSAHPAALAYWDNVTNTVGASPRTINLARAASSLNLSVTPTSTLLTGVTFPAWDGVTLTAHTSMTVTLPLDAPTGLYAIGFQATSPGFGRSETFWGVANYGVPENQVAGGLAALSHVVPEPSTYVLAGLGAALGGVAAAWRSDVVTRVCLAAPPRILRSRPRLGVLTGPSEGFVREIK
jgi:hypothetical protein